ncbi:MAG: NAD(P)/FAD-dependent oxidoreductase [Burkholderiales bacterium]
MNTTYDVVVIGAGVAGLIAAREAARHGLRVCLIEELMFGGLVVNVNQLLPALADLPPSGIDLAAELMTRVSDLGVTSLFETVTSVQTGASLSVVTAGGAHNAQAVIVASGARLRKLGVPGEAEFQDRGVSHCADCDAPLYQGQDVVVVGGGDSALQEALVLSQHCDRVHLVHRGASFSARQEFVAKLWERPNILPRMQTVVEELCGEQALSRVAIRQANGAADGISCTGFFAYVGLEPNTSFLPDQLDRDCHGRVMVDARLESTMRNVYAIGAVRAGYGGQLEDAVSDARSAVMAVARRSGRL